jgi:O-antigen ligase
VARAGAALRGFALCLIPVALVLSHRNLVVVVALIGLVGLASLRMPPRWVWPLLALTGYASLSAFWTPDTDHAAWAVKVPAFVLLSWAAIAAAGRARPAEADLFAGVVVVACLLLGVETASGGAIREALPPSNPPERDAISTARGVTLGLLMMPAAACVLWRRQGSRGLAVAGLAFGALALGAVAYDIAANAAALIAMGAAGAVALARPRLAVGLAAFGFLAALVLSPLAALLPPAEEIAAGEALPVTWRQRLVIWDAVAEALLANPVTFLFGAGHHASGVLGEAAREVPFAGWPVPLPVGGVHPHNVFLEVWYEFGLVGAALSGASVLLGARAFLRTAPPRDLCVAASAGGAAVLVVLLVDASLYTLWRTSAVVLLAYGLSAAAKSPFSGPKRVVNGTVRA